MQVVTNRPQKSNGKSCSFQKWQPHWVGCYRLSNWYSLWRGVV